MSSHFPLGTKIGRYEVRSKIGAGGMGEVYLARDTELDRNVALKILPSQLAGDPQRMRRFVQEAKAASSLNHQHIITIYEIGETDSTRFIATEFVDGVTLRQQLKQGRISLPEVFDIGIQIASGLAAAHEVGIVHRDIKPENIMLRKRDGFVKLLDFGLVKLTEPAAGVADTEAPTRALVNTDAGTVMGTVTYMSPEQTRGKELDSRTDIWSLGVILYEMVTGFQPFSGESSADVIAAIVKGEPAPINRLAPDTPEKLTEIISKTLEKDRDDRYQTAKDLLVDLRRLKKKLDLEAEIERSVSTESEPGTGLLSQAPTTMAGTHTRSLDRLPPTTSAEYIVSEIKKHRVGALLALVIVAVLLGTVTYWLLRNRSHGESVSAPPMKITKLTSGGRINGNLIDGSTSISPDGKYVVYSLLDEGKISLWVRQIATGSDVQIVPASDTANNGTTISPDGEFVYYAATNKENSERALYQVPILGGTPRRVLSRVSSPISFSPDGKQFTFVRELENGVGQALMIANIDGTGESTLAVRKGNDWFSNNGPSWSPDGKTIACAAGTDTGGSYMTVFGYSFASAAITPLTPYNWHGEVRRVLWLSDNSGLVVSAQDSFVVSSPTQLFLLSQPEGSVRRITNDLNGYGAVSLGLSADNRTMVTVQSIPSYQIWTGELNNTSKGMTQVTQGEIDGQTGTAWTSDGNVAFFSKTGDSSDLCVMEPDGTALRRIFRANVSDSNLTASPDGKYFVFSSFSSGTSHIWRINTDGTDPRQITFGDFGDLSANVSPDSQSVLFGSWRSGILCLWKVPITGGEATQVTDFLSAEGFYSPDGKSISTLVQTDQGPRMAIVSTEGGKSPQFITSSLTPTRSPQWTPDGRALILIVGQGATSNLWKQPLDGGKPQQLTNFNSNLISSYSLSPDGKRIALSRGYSSLDIVLIKDFR